MVCTSVGSPSITLLSLSRVQVISSATKRMERRAVLAVELGGGDLRFLDADEGQLGRLALLSRSVIAATKPS